ncbi:MAG: hemerythrin domain-containing protein [Pseudomonadota bacterium]
MATATTTRSNGAARAPAANKDATELLRADHKLVNSLFADYEKARAPGRKKEIVSRICKELSVHAQVEEEIFYPAVKKALKDKELVPEATVEHASLKALIAQVEGVDPDGEMFDAKIKVLSEYVKHHVKEEQNEIFPKAKSSKLDLKELGAEISARKEELMAEQEGAVV